MLATSVAFVAMLLFQLSSSIHVGHVGERREITGRNRKNVIADVESKLRKDCGDECVKVLHAFLPPNGVSHNQTNQAMWGSVLEMIAHEGSRQVSLRTIHNIFCKKGYAHMI